MIKHYTFSGKEKGLRLLFFGAIHGNEICGPKAIRRVIGDIKSKKIILQKGSVTFVPVCNPRGFARGKRYTEENLNRFFRKTKRPRSYEARLANELTKLVDNCNVFLDIHSITANGNAFIYLDYPTTANRRFAQILGPKKVIVGWPALYKKLGAKHPSHDTTTYAAKRGKVGLLIECGQHTSSRSVTIAYRAIRNTLKYYGLEKGRIPTHALQEAAMTHVFFRKHIADRFVRQWKHLTLVKKDEPLIIEANGHVIRAPFTGFVIMPNAFAKVHDDWMYFGRTKSSKL